LDVRLASGLVLLLLALLPLPARATVAAFIQFIA